MRRKDREVLDYQEMLNIMHSCDCCRLGFIDDDSTYIVPLNFGISQKDDTITLYFHSANVGKKLDLIKSNSCVGFEMDTKHELVKGDIACGYSYRYQSIIGKGSISIVDNLNEKILALDCIMQHYTNKSKWEFNSESIKRIAIIKLIVGKWSCKQH